MSEHSYLVAQAREAIEHALQALDDGLLGEAWTALEDAQRRLVAADGEEPES